MQPQLEKKEKITSEIIVVTIIRIGFTSTAINEPYSLHHIADYFEIHATYYPASPIFHNPSLQNIL